MSKEDAAADHAAAHTPIDTSSALIFYRIDNDALGLHEHMVIARKDYECVEPLLLSSIYSGDIEEITASSLDSSICKYLTRYYAEGKILITNRRTPTYYEITRVF